MFIHFYKKMSVKYSSFNRKTEKTVSVESHTHKNEIIFRIVSLLAAQSLK